MSEPAPEAPFVTVAEFANHMNKPDPDPEDQAKLQDHLDAALEWVTEKVGPLTGVAQDFAVFTGGRFLVLPATHLLAVVSVTDPFGNDVTIAAQKIDRLAGIIEVPRSVSGEWTVRASTREHGKAVRLAVLIIASHLYETQRGRAGNAPRDAMHASGGMEGGSTPVGFAIPNRAADLLAPFVIV